MSVVRYQVREWQRHFENERSREIDECRWCKFPNKDGMGRRYIISREHGHKVMCCFFFIVQALSRQRRPRDGWMTYDGTKNGQPWSDEVIAGICLCEVEFVPYVLEVLCSDPVGWICKHSDNNDLQPKRGSGGDKTGGKPRSSPTKTPTEEKRIEERREDSKVSTPYSTEAAQPPRVVQVDSCPADDSEFDPRRVTFPDFPVAATNGGGRTWQLEAAEITRLQATFPAVDVPMESRKAHAWIIANIGRRKTSRGMPRFLFGWMERCQNRGSRSIPVDPDPARQFAHSDPDEVARQQALKMLEERGL